MCLDILGGGTPSTDVPEYWQGDVPWVTLVDSKTKYIVDTERKITAEGLANSNATLLPINTVIFSSRATIGDVSIAKVPVATNQGYKNFICNPEKLSYEFLYYALKYEAPNIREAAEKMTYPEINKNQISDYKITALSLPQQETFVKKMLALEESIHSLEAKIEETRDELNGVIRKHI